MEHEWLGIPDVLVKKLLANGSLIICVLAIGIFMEIRQPGNGFFQLTGLCVIMLFCRFLFMLWIFFRKKYSVLEGEITDIRNGRGRFREVEIMEQNGNREWMYLSGGEKIRLGGQYRIFMRDGEIWGLEELGVK